MATIDAHQPAPRTLRLSEPHPGPRRRMLLAAGPRSRWPPPRSRPAAGTTAQIALTMAGPKELVLDAPFLFVAYETSTLAPLVLGWIGDPTQTR